MSHCLGDIKASGMCTRLKNGDIIKGVDRKYMKRWGMFFNPGFSSVPKTDSAEGKWAKRGIICGPISCFWLQTHVTRWLLTLVQFLFVNSPKRFQEKIVKSDIQTAIMMFFYLGQQHSSFHSHSSFGLCEELLDSLWWQLSTFSAVEDAEFYPLNKYFKCTHSRNLKPPEQKRCFNGRLKVSVK